MIRRTNERKLICFLLIALTLAGGCRSTSKDIVFDRPGEYQPIGTQIEYADACVQPSMAVEEVLPPHILTEEEFNNYQYWDLTLDEAVQIALANSDILRDLGGRVLTGPQGAPSVYDVALIQTGEEAALSAFDTTHSTSLFFDRSEEAFNNVIQGLGRDSNTTNTANFQSEFAKTVATGTQFAIRNRTDYRRRGFIPGEDSGVLQTRFRSVFDTVIEAEFRHPLLRGSGITVNRIAGPNAPVGSYNGILIQRINTDIALADFEASVRDFVNDIYTTYWRLFFAYYNLEAQKTGRESARVSWRTAQALLDAGAGDGLDAAIAKEQYHRFDGLVKNALTGSDTVTGIFTVERQLRLLMGIPANDGRLIRPADRPSRAEMMFDWQESLFNAMTRRVELRRQNWNIKQRELQLIAARNQLRAQLDFIGQYRWRGFGDNLIGQKHRPLGSAAATLFDGDLQGWQLGLAYSRPIGNRLAHTAVRNAELALSRERAVLQNQERYVTNDLSDAFTELSRSFHLTKTRYNQLIAAKDRLDLTNVQVELGQVRFEFVVDAQRVYTDSETELFASLVDYNLAIANVHVARGTFLDYMGVELTEGPWSDAAHFSARKEARRFKPRTLQCYTLPGRVSLGPHEQMILPRGEEEIFTPPPAQEQQEPTPAPMPEHLIPPPSAPNAPVPSQFLES